MNRKLSWNVWYSKLNELLVDHIGKTETYHLQDQPSNRDEFHIFYQENKSPEEAAQIFLKETPDNNELNGGKIFIS